MTQILNNLNIQAFIFGCVILVISIPTVIDTQAQINWIEVFESGSQRSHENALLHNQHRHEQFLQFNQHLHEMRLLEMEIREERRQSTMLSALQGFSGSQYLMGMMLLEEGGLANETDAARWLHLSAEQGFSDAQAALGHLYSSGVGVSSDVTESVKWFQLAADQNHHEAEFQLGVAYYHGLGVVADSSLSLEYIHNAAQNGYPQAQHFMGLVYLHGIRVEIDKEKGVEWIQKAPPEICQIFETCTYLGLLHAQGEGIPVNNEKALLYFSHASDQMQVLNIMMSIGQELSIDAHQTSKKNLALLWFYLADELGHPTAKMKADSLISTESSMRIKRAIRRNIINYVDILLSKTYMKNQEP